MMVFHPHVDGWGYHTEGKVANEEEPLQNTLASSNRLFSFGINFI